MARFRLTIRVICAGWLSVIAPGVSGSALGQPWTAIRLHTDSMYTSRAFGSSGNLVGGSAIIGVITRPVLWNVSSGTWSDLTPLGFDGGEIQTTIAGQQGGEVGASQAAHAALWSGTAGSFTDLHPLSNPHDSGIFGLDAQEQVGYTRPTLTSPYNNAALWRGSASSYVSLHPASAFESQADACADGLQGGHFRSNAFQGAYHAALWAGTAQSMQDLHPAGAIESQILGMASGQQVGWSRAPGTRAAMWHGTAQSYTDMGPPGSGVSLINATCGSAQAGYANFAGSISAVVWFSSPTNFVRLDAFMPSGYGESVATGVSEVDGFFYVSGYARSNSTGRDQAFAWVGVPAPSGPVALGAGLFAATRRRRR